MAFPIAIMRIRSGSGGGGGGGGSFATWNTGWPGMSFTNSDRTVSYNTAPAGSIARSTTALSGKQYFEVTYSPASDGIGPGVCNSTQSLSGPYLGQSVNGAGYYLPSADVYRSAAVIYNGATDSNIPATVGFATDATAGDLKVWIRRADGGGWEGGGDPTTGTSPTFTMATGTYFPACSPGTGSGAHTINAGQAAFTQWTPSGGYAGIPA